MSNITDISLVTYTHSNCKDVWLPYFGQLERHAQLLQSNVFVDNVDEFRNIVRTKNNVYQYDNTQPYYKQWLNCIANVDTKYVIYMQEDFILYDDVRYEVLERCVNFLDETTHSFVRLIRAGFDNTLQHLKDDMYIVPVDSKDIYQQQATIWKKNDLIRVYEQTSSDKWLESDVWRQSVRDLGLSGVFLYNDEKQRGKYHCDSGVFPYICTAVSRGLWNLNEYSNELLPILSHYNINPSLRGIRKDYNYSK